MVMLIQPGRLASTLSVNVNSNESTGPLFLVDSLSFPEPLLQLYEEQCGVLLSRFRCKLT